MQQKLKQHTVSSYTLHDYLGFEGYYSGLVRIIEPCIYM